MSHHRSEAPLRGTSKYNERLNSPAEMQTLTFKTTDEYRWTDSIGEILKDMANLPTSFLEETSRLRVTATSPSTPLQERLAASDSYLQHLSMVASSPALPKTLAPSYPFTWYDTCEAGVKGSAPSLHLEGVCVMYNMAVAHTKLAAGISPNGVSELLVIKGHYLSAASLYESVRSHVIGSEASLQASTYDIQREPLALLSLRCLGAARACHYSILGISTPAPSPLDLAGAAAATADTFTQAVSQLDLTAVQRPLSKRVLEQLRRSLKLWRDTYRAAQHLHLADMAIHDNKDHIVSGVPVTLYHLGQGVELTRHQVSKAKAKRLDLCQLPLFDSVRARLEDMHQDWAGRNDKVYLKAVADTGYTVTADTSVQPTPTPPPFLAGVSVPDPFRGIVPSSVLARGVECETEIQARLDRLSTDLAVMQGLQTALEEATRGIEDTPWAQGVRGPETRHDLGTGAIGSGSDDKGTAGPDQGPHPLPDLDSLQTLLVQYADRGQEVLHSRLGYLTGLVTYLDSLVTRGLTSLAHMDADEAHAHTQWGQRWDNTAFRALLDEWRVKIQTGQSNAATLGQSAHRMADSVKRHAALGEYAAASSLLEGEEEEGEGSTERVARVLQGVRDRHQSLSDLEMGVHSDTLTGLRDGATREREGVVSAEAVLHTLRQQASIPLQALSTACAQASCLLGDASSLVHQTTQSYGYQYAVPSEGPDRETEASCEARYAEVVSCLARASTALGGVRAQFQTQTREAEGLRDTLRTHAPGLAEAEAAVEASMQVWREGERERERREAELRQTRQDGAAQEREAWQCLVDSLNKARVGCRSCQHLLTSIDGSIRYGEQFKVCLTQDIETVDYLRNRLAVELKAKTHMLQNGHVSVSLSVE
ncbi:hypothetical protein KIPB_000381 [Kipferlia bialata]|uniref:BRO1 domain-containing protein n=1 Tax=Kipferlia bialata TaxID=797122 RepID=A0A9K3CNG2_9EUKA|nr:hypothetical protein KIPB_000381 [Kipferlia bialata]|eukprot:g381.t1